MLEKFLITHNNYEAILANATRLAEHNITKIYLRDKNLSTEIFHAFLKIKNVEIFVNYSNTKVILSHKNIHLKSNELHLAMELKHKNYVNLSTVSTNQITKTLSYSAHSLNDIIKAHKLGIDYIFISPIFTTPNKNQPLGLEFIAQIPHEIKPKIFALGGINSNNIKAFETLGIAGIAGIRTFDEIFE